jgi:transposase-like protein
MTITPKRINPNLGVMFLIAANGRRGRRRRPLQDPRRTGGRPPKLTDDDIDAAKAMLANPDIGVTQIAHRLGVSPATLYATFRQRAPRTRPEHDGYRAASTRPIWGGSAASVVELEPSCRTLSAR